MSASHTFARTSDGWRGNELETHFSTVDVRAGDGDRDVVLHPVVGRALPLAGYIHRLRGDHREASGEGALSTRASGQPGQQRVDYRRAPAPFRHLCGKPRPRGSDDAE